MKLMRYFIWEKGKEVEKPQQQEEEVQVMKGAAKLRVTLTNADGLLSSVIKDNLNIHRLDVFCIAETKLKEEILINFQEEGYKIWRRDGKGKGGGGILITVQEVIFVEGVQYGDGMAEVIGIRIPNSGRERRKIVVPYATPKTNRWKSEEYKGMQRGVEMPV